MEENPVHRPSSPISFDFNLPPLPHTMVEAARIISDDSTEDRIAALKQIVAADPMVTARTLRRINSVYYGLQRRVGNVEQAIVLLGFQEVHKLIMTAGLITLQEHFASERQYAIFEHVVRRCIATASVANIISQELYLSCAHLSYTSGLLHAIGRIVLLYNDPTVYEKLWWRDDYPKQPNMRKEKAIYGVNYAGISAQAADAWDLPETLVLAIHHHVDPPEMKSDQALEALTLTTKAARNIADRMIFSEDTTDLAAIIDLDLPALKRVAYMHSRRPKLLLERLVEEENDVRHFVDMVI